MGMLLRRNREPLASNITKTSDITIETKPVVATEEVVAEEKPKQTRRGRNKKVEE